MFVVDSSDKQPQFEECFICKGKGVYQYRIYHPNECGFLDVTNLHLSHTVEQICLACDGQGFHKKQLIGA